MPRHLRQRAERHQLLLPSGKRAFSAAESLSLPTTSDRLDGYRTSQQRRQASAAVEEEAEGAEEERDDFSAALEAQRMLQSERLGSGGRGLLDPLVVMSSRDAEPVCWPKAWHFVQKSALRSVGAAEAL